MQGLKGFLHAVNQAELVAGELGDDLLYAEIDFFRKRASAKFHGGIGHPYEISL